jgi:hypothetical protein
MDARAVIQGRRNGRAEREPAPARRFFPSTGRPAGGGAMLAGTVVGTVVGIVVVFAADRVGWWWMTLVAGLVAGLLLKGRGLAAFCVVVPVAAWGGDLLRQWMAHDLTRIARVTAGLAGLGDHSAWLVYLGTVVYAVLLCVAGGWLSSSVVSLRRTARARRSARAAGRPGPDRTRDTTATPTQPRVSPPAQQPAQPIQQAKAREA